MRVRLAGGIAAAVLLGAMLPASALSAATVTEMRGTITLSGSTSFVRELVLRKPFRMTPANRTVKAAGGRYGGFVIRRHGSDTIFDTPTVASMVSGYCTTRACARPAWVPSQPYDLFTGTTSTPDETSTLLAAGRYWVALVADGKPVTVTLRFPGTGRTSLRSGARTPARIDVPKPSQYGPETPAANTGSLYSAGATHATRSSSLFYYLTSWKYVYGPPKSVNQQGVCAFDGAPPAGHTGAYQYPCGGSEVLNFFAFGQRDTGRMTGPNKALAEYAVTTDAFGVHEVDDRLSIGGFINGASPATSAHTTVLWVDFP